MVSLKRLQTLKTEDDICYCYKEDDLFSGCAILEKILNNERRPLPLGDVCRNSKKELQNICKARPNGE